MLARTRARLANEAATWRHAGIIDDQLAHVLAERYDARGSAGVLLVKWLGLFAVIMLASAILSVIGMLAAQAGPFASTLLAGIVTAGAWWTGARLATDPNQRHPVLGAALITVSLVGAFGTLALIGEAVDADSRRGFPLLLFVVAAAALATAYRFRLRWPLLLGLLALFHAAGSQHAYGGSGAYFADIGDPRLMALIALGAVVIGVFHESRLEQGPLARHAGFGGLYLIFGLLYLDLSLWFLSLGRDPLMFALLFAAAAIGQIVAGSRLHDSRFTGFGIVFLGINLYTRCFEHFWDRVSAGTFFVLAGLAAMALGFVFERLSNRPEARA